MKILFISHNFYPFIGGIEIQSEFLAKSFSKAGHEVKLMTWTPSAQEKIEKINILRNPTLTKLLKAHLWADLVFENNPTLRLSWPLIFTFRPLVVVLHTWMNRNDGSIGFQDLLKKVHLKRANNVIAVSKAIREKTFTDAIVIENPYREGYFTIMPDVDRSKDFVFLGRLVSDKGADQAILAIHQLIKKYNSKFTLTIIGDGPEKQELESLVIKLKLTHYISFKGTLRGQELTKCLNLHKIILVPSLWEEPFGNVALEGMACGCIPIVSDGGGLPEAVGRAGVTFERGNLDSLVNQIIKLISDSLLQDRLKQEAITHLANHRPETIAEQYLKIIEEAFNKNKNIQV